MSREMYERCKDLPDECWEIVFNSMGHHSHLQTLTLVCKRFFSIISHLRTTFNLTVPAILMHSGKLSFIFSQFPNIKSIDLRQAGDSAPRLLDQIIASSLNVQSLDISECSYLSLNRFEVLGKKGKSLRVLRCSKMLGLSDDKLAAITNHVPWVEELDISYSQFLYGQGENVEETNVTDGGIEMISSKMRCLRKIDISGNQFITDKSLMALSRNCVYLEQVMVKNCSMVTVVGIQFLVKNSPNLTWLAVSQIDFKTKSLNLSTRDCFSCAIHLSTLDIDDAEVSDYFLYSLSGSGIPLKSFTLTHCDGFGCDGISFLLKKFPSLEYLNLVDARFSNHTFVLEEFSNCFSKLTTIKLKICDVGVRTFFMLVKSCPLLEHIDMGNTIMGAGDDMIDFVLNPHIKSLNLSCNPYLSDKWLAILVLACPFLEMLDVSFCSKITEKGISNVLNRCSNIKHLEINGCEGIENIGEGIELSKLEILRAKSTSIDDTGLAVIGKRCFELLNLDLEGCLRVTTKGLKDMLEHCRRLREINLKQCVNVSIDIMDWMVFTRPSLRKIIPPYSSFPDVCQMHFYLRHGCYVWTPPVDKEYEGKKYCYNFEMRFQDVEIQIYQTA